MYSLKTKLFFYIFSFSIKCIMFSGWLDILFCHNVLYMNVYDLLYNLFELACAGLTISLFLSVFSLNSGLWGNWQHPVEFWTRLHAEEFDPILITIIVMSAVGVLLGAVCGVLFYCACAHTTNRNLSALENYNFELVDGVKLKKEKLSAQKSYSEAWGMLDEPRKHMLDNVGGTFLERCYNVSQGRDWALFSGRAGRETGL